METPQILPITKEIPSEELTTLLKVSAALAASLDLSVVLQTAINSTVEVLRLDTGAIYLLDEGKLYLGATTPPLTPDLSWLKLQPENVPDHPHIQKALRLGQPVLMPDVSKAQLSPAEAEISKVRGLKTNLYIPLHVEGQPIGVLIVSSTGAIHTFCEHDLALSRTLSYQIALALANARLYKGIQQANAELLNAYDTTLQGWSDALEMRDQETQGHTRRVIEATLVLARRMGFTEPALTQLWRGALLHDIGKISIPDAILGKPGPLTAEEMAVMRCHTDYAYQFLLKIPYLLPAIDIPYCHHEKWDGSGYPRGLSGEQIPLAARIFAVVDVYDALTSDRPYRKAWTKADALAYIRAQCGSHFDPAIVPVFLEMVAENG